MVTLGSHQISGSFWPVVICSSPGPSINNSRILETDSRDPETEIGSLETETRVHRIHDTLETGLQRIVRSSVAPARGAGGLDRNESRLIGTMLASQEYHLILLLYRLWTSLSTWMVLKTSLLLMVVTYKKQHRKLFPFN